MFRGLEISRKPLSKIVSDRWEAKITLLILFNDFSSGAWRLATAHGQAESDIAAVFRRGVKLVLRFNHGKLYGSRTRGNY